MTDLHFLLAVGSTVEDHARFQAETTVSGLSQSNNCYLSCLSCALHSGRGRCVAERM